MQKRIFTKILFTLAVMLGFTIASAATNTIDPYVPHVYVNGYSGAGAANLLGIGDVLAPIYLGSNKNFFLYGQGRYSGHLAEDDLGYPYSVAFGLGYRQIPSFLKSQLFGVYVLADYMNSQYDNKYWNISPGIETLGVVDFRANAYIPVGVSKYVYNTYVFDHFQGHDEYDRLYENTEEDARGVDAEIGTKLFSIGHMPIKGYISGYYFNGNDADDVTGIGGRLSFQPTRYLTIELKDTYDNVQHNVFMGGIKFYINGYLQNPSNTNVDNQPLQNRLYDPIERNFGGIGSGTGIPGGMTFSKDSKYKGTPILRDHIIFTEEGSSALNAGAEVTGSGTFEDPYIYTAGAMPDVVAKAYNTFSDYTYLYFSAGNYDMGTDPISLYSNQSVWGRSADFITPATTGQVTFTGGFGLSDVSNVGWHNFTLLNNAGNFDYGINIENAQSGAVFIFDGITVGTDQDNPDAYRVGAKVGNSQGAITVDIDNSNFSGVSNVGASISGVGFWIDNANGQLTASIDNSAFYGSTAKDQYNPAAGFFINSTDQSAINVTNITNSQFTSIDSIYSEGFAIWSANAKPIEIGDITNSDFTAQITDYTNYVRSEGFYVANYNSFTNGSINLGDINNSHFFGTYSGLLLTSNSDISIGKIENNSEFESTEAYDDYKLLAGMLILSKANIYLAGIEDSKFTGNSNGAFINAYYGNLITINGDIKNSTFYGKTGHSGYGSAGLYLVGNIVINGNIKDSTFSSENDGGSGAQFTSYGVGITINGDIDGSTFYGLSQGAYFHVYNNANITINGDIKNSTFSSYRGPAFIFASFGSGNATINGDIKNSTFLITNSDPYYSYPSVEFYAGNNLTIGNIEDSTFQGDGGNAAFFDAEGNLTIGSITGSKFYDPLILYAGGIVEIANTPYNTGLELRSYLLNQGNIPYSVVCINSSCV